MMIVKGLLLLDFISSTDEELLSQTSLSAKKLMQEFRNIRELNKLFTVCGSSKISYLSYDILFEQNEPSEHVK